MTKRAWAIDVAMVILLPLLMAYSLVGEGLHEFLGIAMFALFCAHQGSHWWYFRHWRAGAKKEHLISNIVNIALVIAFITVPLAGMCMSTTVMPQLAQAVGYLGVFRRIHLMGAYWAFVLAGIHAGMHVSMMWASVKDHAGHGRRLSRFGWIGTLVWAGLAGLGMITFGRRGIWGYLSGRVAFVYLSGSLLGFLADYVALTAFTSAFGWLLHALWHRWCARLP